jgi:hypothetical protein
VFCPILLLLGYALVRYFTAVPTKPLLVPALLASAGQLAMLACFTGWHAGHCYGPRYFCDVLPWFFLLAVLAYRGAQGSRELAAVGAGRPRLVGELALAAVLCGWGLFVHTRGALSVATLQWNATVDVDVSYRGSVFDWRYPQFLAGMIPPPRETLRNSVAAK